MFERNRTLEALSRQAYIDGFSMVTGHRTLISYAMQSAKSTAGLQQMRTAPLGIYGVSSALPAEAASRPCVFLWLDLRQEPMVVTVGPREGSECYSVQFLDLHMKRIGYIAPRARELGAASFIVAGPDWDGNAPPDITGVFRSSTRVVQLICRLHPRQAEHGAQSVSCIHPLSRFLGKPPRLRDAVIDWPPHDFVGSDPLDFFMHLDFLLAFCPQDSEAHSSLKRLAKKSSDGSCRFHPTNLSSQTRWRIRQGVDSAARAMHDELRSATSPRDLLVQHVPPHRKALQNAAAAKIGVYGVNEKAPYYLPHCGPDWGPAIGPLPMLHRAPMVTLPLSCGVDPECGVRSSYRVTLPRTKIPAMANMGAYSISDQMGEAGNPARGVVKGAASSSSHREDINVVDLSLRTPLRMEENHIRIVQRLSLDRDGRVLMGTRRYVLHFQPNRLPPVGDFWSLSTSKDKSIVVRPLQANGIKGEHGLLRLGPDGSLDIFLQARTPGPLWANNWLPLEPGPFHLVLKLYAPGRAILTGAWSAPLPTCVG